MKAAVSCWKTFPGFQFQSSWSKYCLVQNQIALLFLELGLQRGSGGKDLTQSSIAEAAVSTTGEGWGSSWEAVQAEAGHVVRVYHSEVAVRASKVPFYYNPFSGVVVLCVLLRVASAVQWEQACSAVKTAFINTALLCVHCMCDFSNHTFAFSSFLVWVTTCSPLTAFTVCWRQWIPVRRWWRWKSGM